MLPAHVNLTLLSGQWIITVELGRHPCVPDNKKIVVPPHWVRTHSA